MITLTYYLEGLSAAGNKLKSTTDWDNNTEKTFNSSGFSAHPGDFRDYNGTFNDVGRQGYLWFSSESNIHSAWIPRLSYFSSGVFCNTYPKVDGPSLRCVRDK